MMIAALLAATLITPQRLPALMCSTVYGCTIRLLPGETIQQVQLTDPRWQASVVAPGPLPVATIKILPIASAGALRSEVDIATNINTYRTVVIATDEAASNLLQYQPDPTPQPKPFVFVPPAPTPTPLGEVASIRPDEIQQGWYSKGAPGCQTVFGVLDRGQVWCYLPQGERHAPACYHLSGRTHIPADCRVVRGNILIIETLDTPLSMEFGDGTNFTIDRSARQ
jgi:hypothetical protein